ncbi:MAG: hypothetical protein A2096_17530 [Spirochaetes bacterium GWF1_41_5]|nr:MAG: hypothetical protein A2096_17530 [Spirochaetes bacterium GWF1_41_5]
MQFENNSLFFSHLGMRITGVGSADKGRQRSWFDEKKFRTLNCYAAVYLAGGSGFMESAAGRKIYVEKGSCMFLFPGVPHRYGPEKNQSWHEYWFLFDGFIFDEYVKTRVLDPSRPVISHVLPEKLLKKWRQLALLAGKHPPDLPLITAGFREIFFSILSPLRRDSLKEKNSDLAERIISEMEKHIADSAFNFRRFSVNQQYSYSWLRKLFKKYTGSSPEKFMQRLKIREAKKKLLYSADRIKEISAELGFTDQYYFSRLFRKIEGFSPRQYRHSYAEWK